MTRTFLSRLEHAAEAYSRWAAACDAAVGAGADDGDHFDPILAPMDDLLDSMIDWPEISSMEELAAMLRLAARVVPRHSDHSLVDVGHEGLIARAVLAGARLLGKGPKPLGYRIYDEQIAAKVDETLTLREQFEKHVDPVDENGAIYLEGLARRIDGICSLRGGPRGAFHKLRLFRVEIPADVKQADEFRLMESAIADLGQISIAKPIAEPHPDTALIAACEKVIELQIASYTATGETEIEQDERTGSILAEMEIAVDRLVELRAVTPLGILARVRTLDCADPDHGYTFDDKGSLCGRQLAALRRDTAEIGHLPRAWQLQVQLRKVVLAERRDAARRARRAGSAGA